MSSYLPYLLRQADQALSAPLYEVLNRHGVARSEWRVLAVLNEFGELGVVELAQHSLSPQPTVTHAVGRLKERGLVERTRGVQDKRQRLVVLTPAGTKVTRSLIKQAEELERTALAHAGDRSRCSLNCASSRPSSKHPIAMKPKLPPRPMYLPNYRNLDGAPHDRF